MIAMAKALNRGLRTMIIITDTCDERQPSNENYNYENYVKNYIVDLKTLIKKIRYTRDSLSVCVSEGQTG